MQGLGAATNSLASRTVAGHKVAGTGKPALRQFHHGGHIHNRFVAIGKYLPT